MSLFSPLCLSLSLCLLRVVSPCGPSLQQQHQGQSQQQQGGHLSRGSVSFCFSELQIVVILLSLLLQRIYSFVITSLSMLRRLQLQRCVSSLRRRRDTRGSINSPVLRWCLCVFISVSPLSLLSPCLSCMETLNAMTERVSLSLSLQLASGDCLGCMAGRGDTRGRRRSRSFLYHPSLQQQQQQQQAAAASCVSS